MKDSAGRWRRAVLGAGLLIATQACESDIERVTVYFPACGNDASAIAVGDSVLLDVVALSEYPPTAFARQYSNEQQPGSFTYVIDPDNLATLHSGRVLLGENPGFGSLSATAEGTTGSIPLTVCRAPVRVDVQSPASGAVASTVTLSFAAFDLFGEPQSLEGTPVVAEVGTAARAAILDGLTNETVRVRIDQAGPILLRWCFGGRTGLVKIDGFIATLDAG